METLARALRDKPLEFILYWVETLCLGRYDLIDSLSSHIQEDNLRFKNLPHKSTTATQAGLDNPLALVNFREFARG